MKITRTKMDTKIKWNESFVFFQGEEEKKREEEKNTLEPHRQFSTAPRLSIKKSLMSCF